MIDPGESARAAQAGEPVAFEPDDEVEELLWWDGGPLPRLAALDAEIVRRTPEPHARAAGHT